MILDLIKDFRSSPEAERMIQNLGLKGAIQSLYYSFRHTESTYSLLLGKKVKVDISNLADVSISSAFIMDVYNTRMIDQALGGSYLYLSDSASFNITSDSPVYIGSNSLLDIEGDFKMGDSYINGECKIICREQIEIGDGCAIAWNFTLMDNHGQHFIYDNKYNESEGVELKDNIWAGHNVTIMPGVTIGSNSVIASNSLILEDVPSNTLVGGIPAEVIREDITWGDESPDSN